MPSYPLERPGKVEPDIVLRGVELQRPLEFGYGPIGLIAGPGKRAGRRVSRRVLRPQLQRTADLLLGLVEASCRNQRPRETDAVWGVARVDLHGGPQIRQRLVDSSMFGQQPATQLARVRVSRVDRDRRFLLGQRTIRLAETRIDLGLVAAGEGEIDEACELGRQALASERKSGSTLGRVAELDAVLMRGHPDVGEVVYLHERFQAARRALT